MSTLLTVQILYGIAAAYDGLLGLAFLAAGPQMFKRAGIEPPNHWGYVHFAAGMLIIFGLMFFMIAWHPTDNWNLAPYGILLKVCYIATVAWHSQRGSVPDVWKYFALVDAVFAVLFVWSLAPLSVASHVKMVM